MPSNRVHYVFLYFFRKKLRFIPNYYWYVVVDLRWHEVLLTRVWRKNVSRKKLKNNFVISFVNAVSYGQQWRAIVRDW